jgi:hypothetical protein
MSGSAVRAASESENPAVDQSLTRRSLLVDRFCRSPSEQTMYRAIHVSEVGAENYIFSPCFFDLAFYFRYHTHCV